MAAETRTRGPLLARLHGPGAREAAQHLTAALRSSGYEAVSVASAMGAMDAGGVRMDADPYRVSTAMSQQERMEAACLIREGVDAVIDGNPPLDISRLLGGTGAAALERFGSMPSERSVAAARRVSSAKAVDIYVGGANPDGPFITEAELKCAASAALAFANAPAALGDGSAKGSPLLAAVVSAIEGLDRSAARSETVAEVREAIGAVLPRRTAPKEGRSPRFVAVQLPAASVRSVKNGRLRGTLPEGTSVDGRDLGGFSFFANSNERRVGALSKGRPVNFAFLAVGAVHLSRWDADTKGYLDVEVDPWKLSSALKARRTAIETERDALRAALPVSVESPPPLPRGETEKSR